MEIYKEHLIEALETEPLHWGSWASVYRTPYTTRNEPLREIPNCKVCAVGSVFRTFSEVGYYDLSHTVTSLLEGCCSVSSTKARDEYDLPQNWITACSFVWEGLRRWNSGIKIPEARTIMLDWVDENVPSDIILWNV